MRRLALAFTCFFRVLFGRPLPPEVLPPAPEPKALPEPKPKEIVVEVKKPDPTGGALALLGLFQREGRLVDFLSESIEQYDDAAIGAAVRDIHRGCKKVLDDHVAVEAVISGEENDSITVDQGFDPARIRLVGNVVGEPPFKGVLRHHGWRAVKVALPTPSDGVDPTVVAPAEVELS